MIDHTYKGFILRRNGCKSMPWNIYNKYNVWVGYGYSLKGCKMDIDDGCFDDDENRIY